MCLGTPKWRCQEGNPMIIFAIIAIGLVVIVAGGFVGRSRMNRTREQNARNATHKTTHHGKAAHNSRGRGRGH
jgi:hypothetical protein